MFYQFIGAHFIDKVYEALYSNPRFQQLSFDAQGELSVEIANVFIGADLFPTPEQVEIIFNRKIAA